MAEVGSLEISIMTNIESGKFTKPPGSSYTSSSSGSSGCCEKLISYIQKANDILDKIYTKLSTTASITVPGTSVSGPISTNIPGKEEKEPKVETERDISISKYIESFKKGLSDISLSDIQEKMKSSGYSEKAIGMQSELLKNIKTPGTKEPTQIFGKANEFLEGISLKLLGLDVIAKWLKWIYEGFASTGFGKAIDSMLGAIAQLFWLPIAEKLFNMLYPILNALLDFASWWAEGGFNQLWDSFWKSFPGIPITLGQGLEWLKNFELKVPEFLKTIWDTASEKLKWLEQVGEKINEPIKWLKDKVFELKLPEPVRTMFEKLGLLPKETKLAEGFQTPGEAVTRDGMVTEGGLPDTNIKIPGTNLKGGIKQMIGGMIAQAITETALGPFLDDTQKKMLHGFITGGFSGGALGGLPGAFTGAVSGLYGETGLPGSSQVKTLAGAINVGGLASILPWLAGLAGVEGAGALTGPAGLSVAGASLASENSLTATLAGPLGLLWNWQKTGINPLSPEGQQGGRQQLGDMWNGLFGNNQPQQQQPPLNVNTTTDVNVKVDLSGLDDRFVTIDKFTRSQQTRGFLGF